MKGALAGPACWRSALGNVDTKTRREQSRTQWFTDHISRCKAQWRLMEHLIVGTSTLNWWLFPKMVTTISSKEQRISLETLCLNHINHIKMYVGVCRCSTKSNSGCLQTNSTLQNYFCTCNYCISYDNLVHVVLSLLKFSLKKNKSTLDGCMTRQSRGRQRK